MPRTRHGHIHVGQAVHDAAVFDRMLAVALVAQRRQLRLQLLKFFNTRVDVRDVLVDQRMHAAAAVRRRVGQTQQCADFVVSHVERAAIANEAQALDMLCRVTAVIGFGALRLGQQALFFVETDGFRRAMGNFRQFADFHGPFLHAALTL